MRVHLWQCVRGAAACVLALVFAVPLSLLGQSHVAQLAARSQKAQTDFAAGNLSDRDLIIILIAIAALILIIVAVR